MSQVFFRVHHDGTIEKVTPDYLKKITGTKSIDQACEKIFTRCGESYEEICFSMREARGMRAQILYGNFESLYGMNGTSDKRLMVLKKGMTSPQYVTLPEAFDLYRVSHILREDFLYFRDIPEAIESRIREVVQKANGRGDYATANKNAAVVAMKNLLGQKLISREDFEREEQRIQRKLFF